MNGLSPLGRDRNVSLNTTAFGHHKIINKINISEQVRIEVVLLTITNASNLNKLPV